MYNAHRGIAGAPAPPNNRLAELLEQVRAEFEAQGGRANEYEHQRESSPFVPSNTFPWDRHLQIQVLFAVFSYLSDRFSSFFLYHHRHYGIPQS
jgi:hypothetical protein